MFATITQYTNADFFKQRPIISFDPLYEGYLQPFISRVYYTKEKNVFRFYQYTDLSEPTVFNEYLEQVKADYLYETNMEIS